MILGALSNPLNAMNYTSSQIIFVFPMKECVILQQLVPEVCHSSAPSCIWLAQQSRRTEPWQLAAGHFGLLVHFSSLLPHFLPASLELLIFIQAMHNSAVGGRHWVTEFKKREPALSCSIWLWMCFKAIKKRREKASWPNSNSKGQSLL